MAFASDKSNGFDDLLCSKGKMIYGHVHISTRPIRTCMRVLDGWIGETEIFLELPKLFSIIVAGKNIASPIVIDY